VTEPLHVRVARALGWTDIQAQDDRGYDVGSLLGGGMFPRVMPEPRWVGVPPDWHDGIVHDYNCDCGSPPVPRYDTSWKAMGPQIERFGINLRETHVMTGRESHPNELPPPVWDAYDRENNAQGTGATPLLAVCHLFLALSAAGKLDAGREG
jgi:hypothetical protein